jgi:hypothetical protein
MRHTRKKWALMCLHLVTGLVLFSQAFALAFHGKSILAFAKSGVPDWVRLGLAWGEMLAALLFLLPPTVVAGAWLLLFVLAGAVILHLALGEGPGALLVYMAAVTVVLCHRRPQVQMEAP